jgi:hypothetical protein
MCVGACGRVLEYLNELNENYAWLIQKTLVSIIRILKAFRMCFYMVISFDTAITFQIPVENNFPML